ncbi:MAG TPA: hypothetical protein VG326_19680 [Tepidisphaeraceae bacterium]|jgi:hypothetical protein|nr:hypothetical protein [Tepidisphaeraceae bacterium]
MKSRIGAKTRFLAAALSLGSVVFPVIGAGAAARADDLKNDARLEGYHERVILDAGGAQYYMLFGLLGIIGISVMFKDAKRSHLD